MYCSTFLTSASILALVSALPTPKAASAAISDSYTYYTGDGSVTDGWPDESSWGSWSDLWAANAAIMPNTCGWNGWGTDDSSTEIADIQTAIEQVASSTGVDERFILAIMMQESKGCVRVPTTNNGVVNPGLMQSHDGSGTCAGVDPCPQSEITQMITDGTSGTSSGNGLQQLIPQAESTLGVTTSQAFYAAARLYNSGSADYSNLDDGLGSTPCYASDVANRLTGWVLAASSCTA
jgi:hypothetical protein